LQPCFLKDSIKKYPGGFKSSQVGVNHPVLTPSVERQHNEERRGRHPNLSMNIKLFIFKERKKYLIGIPVKIDFIGIILCSDPDQFDLPVRCVMCHDQIVQLVYRGSLPLTDGSVHAVNLNEKKPGINFIKKKFSPMTQSQIIFMLIVQGNRKLNIGHHVIWLQRFPPRRYIEEYGTAQVEYCNCDTSSFKSLP